MNATEQQQTDFEQHKDTHNALTGCEATIGESFIELACYKGCDDGNDYAHLYVIDESGEQVETCLFINDNARALAHFRQRVTEIVSAVSV